MKDLFPRTVSRLDSECTYTTGVEETSVPNTFNGNNDVRSCPFGSFRNTQSVQNCISDATFLNPTTGAGFPLLPRVQLPLLYRVSSITISSHHVETTGRK